MSKEYRVAVVGATGAVGERCAPSWPSASSPSRSSCPWLRPSRRAYSSTSAARTSSARNSPPTASRASTWPCSPRAAAPRSSSPPSPATPAAWSSTTPPRGAWIPDVPLVVPEVNPDDVDWHKGIIANPNCSTIQMVVVMKPLHDEAQITRVVVSTYQAVSGTGAKAIEELVAADRHRSWPAKTRQSRSIRTRSPSTACRRSTSSSRTATPKRSRRWWTRPRRSWATISIAVTATCVRVPVQNGHSESVNLEFARPISAERARELLAAAPGVELRGRPGQQGLPHAHRSPRARTTPTWAASGVDPTVANGLNLWVVADNLRKGAALNAVQIAELLVERDLVRVPR